MTSGPAGSTSASGRGGSAGALGNGGVSGSSAGTLGAAGRADGGMSTLGSAGALVAGMGGRGTAGAAGASAGTQSSSFGGGGGSSGAGVAAGSGGGGGASAGTSGAGSAGMGMSGAAGMTTGGVTFAQVQSILSASCATSKCHPNSFGHTDLHNSDGMLYTRLMGSAPTKGTDAKCLNRTLVVPGDPDKSLLQQMIEAADGPRMGCGTRMPDDCTKDNTCLRDDDIATIRSWIAAGAPK